MKKVHVYVSIGAMLLTAAAVSATNNKVDQGQANWAEHVAPILFNNCATCHRPGQVAPMSLLTYKETRPWAKSIRRVTAEGTMPPWFANPEHGEFVEDSRLSKDEIDTIAKWVAAGAPSGDLAGAPSQPTFDSEWRMGEPDVVLTMKPFEVTDEMEDHYQWVEVENPLDEDRWIKAIEIRPTFTAGAHHNLTYLAPGDATIESIQGAGRIETDFIAGWAPGVMPMVYREGYGKLFPANSKIFFQMHYHKTPGEGTGGIDQTSVGLKFHEGEAENRLTTLWIVDPVLNIPPGEANYESVSSFDFKHDALIFNYTPHMHLRGKSMRFTAAYPDGKEEILLDVPDYDFNWQLTYTPPQPLEVPAGTKVTLEAVFDNSAENESNPDPTATVRFGERTDDEMMIGFLDYTYVDQAEQSDMETYAVPEHLREQMKRLREFRDKAKAEAAEQSSGQ